MLAEYGLFSDEGCVEAQMYSEAEAHDRLAAYDPEDDLVIKIICPWHEEQPADTCEECAADLDDTDEEQD